MKRLWILILLFSNCNHEVEINTCEDTFILNEPPCQTFIEVVPPCIIQEVIKKADGHEVSRYIYHYDGVNYNRIDIYNKGVWEDEYPEEPTEIATLVYDDGRIKEVTIQSTDAPNSSRKSYFEYSNEKVTITFEIIENNVVKYTATYDQLFLINPKDSTYVNESENFDILREYKAGNNTRFAVEADSGKCIINNQRWSFTVKTSFDLYPNVFRDYAVRFPMGLEAGYASQFWFGNNKNNIVATVDLPGGKNKKIYCYTFLQSGTQIWIKEYEFTAAYANHYIYKYSCE
ncbi:MAG: hypothetical protein UZ12_BCD005000885 [Bacteroidetes bacterium OLB12]|nr:MAG: hypothetical protein UZ12_BCD005000885 [Bacteroidetes bacterium OLB12]